MPKSILLVFLLLSNFNSHSQDVNAIEIKNTDSKKIVSVLQSNGLPVAFDGFKTYTTIPKRLSNKGTISLTVKITDTSSILSGIFEEEIITPKLFKNKSSYGDHDLSGSWRILEKIAGEIGGNIHYLKINISPLVEVPK
jgi:hypothetical protein